VDDAKCILVARASVCLCVCVHRRVPTLLHRPGCNLGNGKGCPLVVHHWADLQSVHGFPCYDNIAPNAKCRRVLVLALCLVCFMCDKKLHYISRESKTTRNVLWSRASVCLSVCLSAAACPHYYTDPDVTWGSGSGCPLVVRCWADLQSVHLMRCYGNIMEMLGRASGNPPGPAHAARTHARTSDKIDAKIGRVRRYQQRGRSISSVLRGCCNANAKC